MSDLLLWICERCGEQAKGLSVDEYMGQRDHVCKTSNIIRRAVSYFRARAIPTCGAIADWLESCARQADRMSNSADFAACAEPDSVRHALNVAVSTPWQAT
jgi:hypothetical protein